MKKKRIGGVLAAAGAAAVLSGLCTGRAFCLDMESTILIHFAFPKHFCHVHSGIPLQGYFHRLFIFIIYLQGNRCSSYRPAGKDNLLLLSDYRFPINKKLRFSLFSHKIRGFHLIPEETLLSVNSVHLKFFVILQIFRQGN